MVKYAVMSSLKFESITDRESLKANIITTSDKPTWGEKRIQDSNTMDGKPMLKVTVRFESRKDMDELFAKIKQEMLPNKALEGSMVHRHLCYHDVLPFRPCEVLEEHVIEDVSKD